MSLRPSSNVAITSSRSRRSAGPLLIQFGPDWRDNGIMDWYGPRPTKIHTLQLRREKSEPFNHQYIVVILADDSILRLDRRGDETKPVDAMTRDGTDSKDTIANVNSLSDLDKTSSCLAELHYQGSDVDLSSIIKVCFGIHRDHKAGRYTLQRFNCYFFAWTILVVTARQAMPWDTHPFNSPWEELSRTLPDALATKYADALIDMIVDGGVITIMAIQLKWRPQLSRAVPPRARLAWAMPQWFMRLTLRVTIRWWGARVHTSLRHMLRKSLLSVLQPTLRSALADLRASILRTLRTILWKDDVRDTFRDAAHRDVTASLLMAGMNALSSVRLRMEFPAVGGTAQKLLRATFVALVQAVVRAAPLFAAHGDDAKWDETWNSIRDTIREAAERAMKDMEGRWGTLWEGMMEEWVAGWEVFRPKMRGTARRTIKEMTELVNTALVYSVIETLPDTPLHIGVVKNMVPRFRHVSDPTFELQPYILKLIREHARVVGRYGFGSPAKVEKDMREAMDRVWRVVAGLDGGGANAEDNPTADVS
ncbi:hypothetical protein BS47DRAFT_369198 [Hydnum rufescens UP504]|uniref:Uncharacterized protein n=1 Tax=Hydnum rufescens UP504 TaxID=1448309 RepID=A0A9P6AJI6_9AGAM|nr:hypothetical protein BS47DRAFT_369198 [Hydnum rufescens UP504]